ncbi:hypothetical protein GTP91_08960 [Rugamonas sp. FT82W]|uniref:Lipoprotein n=1 Tax=Duganella vulcania TaxID=2692166 RepID=A0A845G129_9BURK|nr:hypothetical protein [Duganella vulcania]MYM87310.1 hypothetical protein [Duganella vulcania]
MKQYGTPAILVGLASSMLLLACAPKTPQVAAEDIRIAKLEPLASSGAGRDAEKIRLVKSSEPDYVPEPVAQALLAQLKQWPKTGTELGDALNTCSALLAAKQLGDKSACLEAMGEDEEAACHKQHGYGRKTVGQALTADHRDLNGDGVKDYIISDRYYCTNLSANQGAVYFVMLSQPKGGYQLAFADWAAPTLYAVDAKADGKAVLVERIAKLDGATTRILNLVDAKYVRKSCVFQDEHGYSACPL